MPNLYTLGDVVARMRLVMEYFDNNVTDFVVHLAKHLDKHLRTYKPQLFLEYHPPVKQEEKQKEKPTPATTEMSMTATAIGDSRTMELEQMFNSLSSAFKSDTLGNLIDLLKVLEGGNNFLRSGGLEEAQRMRRASTLDDISGKFTDKDRKLSAIEKNAVVVDAAIKLAEVEQIEDERIEQDDDLHDEYKSGDEVIIIEGENVGLFGTLQNSTGGVFGVFDEGIKEDEEGNFGVDVHMSDGQKEGYWIHPEAMQLKRYVAGQEVKIIDGLNKGQTGTIQEEEGRLRFDEGSYGVDVKMNDGSAEGFWIYPTSMQPMNEPEKEKHDDAEDSELIDKFEFLPYIPYPGDALDEALADQLNTFEIDVNIRRLVANSGKVVYRFNKQRHLVRFIHGIILVKETGVWTELIPILRNLSGMEKVDADIFSKK